MRGIGIFLVLLILLTTLLAPSNFAQEKVIQRGEAVVVKVTGPVKMLRAPWWNFWAWKELKVGQELWDGDRIQVGRKGSIELQFYNKTQVRILENSTVVIGKSTLYNYGADATGRASSIFVQSGEVWVQVEKAVSKIFKFKVETPNAVAGVRGTLFAVQVKGKITDVIVDNGTVEVQQRRTAENVLVSNGSATQVVGKNRPKGAFPVKDTDRSSLKNWGREAQGAKYDIEALKEKKEKEEKNRKDKEEKEKKKNKRENGQNKERETGRSADEKKDREDKVPGDNGQHAGGKKGHTEIPKTRLL